MRSRDYHGYAGFADLQVAEPVHHGDATDGVIARDVGSDLRHGLDSHGLIAFGFEEPRGTAFGVIARDSLEVDERAVFGAQKFPRDGRAVDRLSRQRVEVARG